MTTTRYDTAGPVTSGARPPDLITAPRAGGSEAADPHHARRWLVLGVLALAQLMVILDATPPRRSTPPSRSAVPSAPRC